MKANILIKNLKNGENIETVTSKLSGIKGLTDIAVDNETSRVSFNYETEEAALTVIEKIKLSCCGSCKAEKSGNCQKEKGMSVAN